MPNMSYMITPNQFLDGSKDVTRRNGWWNIKIGVVHTAVLKSQGLKKGEKVQVLGKFIPISSKTETLSILLDDYLYGKAEVIREGFPHLTPLEFCEMFMKSHKGVTLYTPINRIEFKKENV